MSALDSIKSALSAAAEAAQKTIDSTKNAANLIRGKAAQNGLNAATIGTERVKNTPVGLPSTITCSSLSVFGASSFSGSVSISGGLYSSTPVVTNCGITFNPVPVDALPPNPKVGTLMFVSDDWAKLEAIKLLDSTTGPAVCPVFWDGQVWRRTY